MNDEQLMGRLAAQFTLRWVAPPGWEQAPEGFCPDANWRPDPYWPDSPPHWQYWQVDGPEDVLASFAVSGPVVEPTKSWIAPPGWPTPRQGFEPAEGWRPDPSWPSAPANWRFWQVTPQAQHDHERASVATRGLRLRKLNGMEHLLSHHLHRFRRDLRVQKSQLPVRTTPKALEALNTKLPSLGRRTPMENWHRTKVKRLESLTEAVVTVRNILVTAVGSDSAVPEMYYDWDHELTMRYNAYDAVTAPATLLAPRSDAPTLGLYDVSTPDQLMGFESHWQAAELLAAGFLRRVGFNDAAVTSAGADGGVDVRGAGVAAQVKYTGSPVGRPVLQQLIGATRGSRPVCFSRSGFSKQAYAYALESGIALFNLELPNNVTAKNPSAAHLVSHMRN